MTISTRFGCYFAQLLMAYMKQILQTMTNDDVDNMIILKLVKLDELLDKSALLSNHIIRKI